MSDLHLEGVPFPDLLELERPDFDVLVSAGDVWGRDPVRAIDYVARLADGRPSIFVLGNHEFWGSSFEKTVDMARARAAKKGVTLLHRDEAEVEGVRFAGATLWTDYTLRRDTSREVLQGEPILAEGSSRQLGIDDLLAAHFADRAWLGSLRVGDLPLVVVTHHAPLPGCVQSDQRHPFLSASDLAREVAAIGADHWLHGHVHHGVDFVADGGTRVVCNPFGVGGFAPGFVEDLVLEVPACGAPASVIVP